MSAEVCVLMPVRNAEATLPAAIRSIIGQSFENWRLRILDDGSADDSRRIAEEMAAGEPRVTVEPGAGSLGLAGVLNAAVAAVTEPFVARMDADDVSYPDRLEQQMAEMRRRESLDLLGCEMLVFDSDGRARGKRAAPAAHAEIVARPLAGFPLYHPTWLARTEWLQAQRYDVAAERCEDQVLLFDAYRRSSFANLDRVLFGYRDPGVRLARELRGRFHYATAVARRSDRASDAARAIGGQLAKGLVESIVVPLGLEERALRHRTRPLSDAEQAEWLGVEQSLGLSR